MLHLLLKTSLFMSLPNDCLCQLTGEPLMFVPPPSGMFLRHELPRRMDKRKRESPQETQPRKRLKLIRTTSNSREHPIGSSVRHVFNQVIERRTAADISFLRGRLFYSRPNRDPAVFRMVVGLPHQRNTFSVPQKSRH
ncbi:hypothetical protein PAXRUDRAFT_280337 [Paxillus rubicundulus Ve08.2h10]|uniref:Secreted protein n=1 Tax=Paxillus rubicundulus Ve08.2h10 TaxID=930991 RepID=A0A0D0DSZ6_9AGAM|nr:hypothetical protein PAXRUDRAFT_280337 [Paxillus rubicundulus Ve08.2h10]